MVFALLQTIGSRLLSQYLLAGFITGPQSFPQPLSAEDEIRYVNACSNGDENARNLLIEHNLRLVAHVARKYSGSSVDSDDLISIGTIGLIKAVSSYDPDKGIRLATYAARCIENEILMHLRASKSSKTKYPSMNHWVPTRRAMRFLSSIFWAVKMREWTRRLI